MKSFGRVLLILLKAILIILIILIVVFSVVLVNRIKKTNYDDKYLASVSTDKISFLEDCYYDSEEKSIVFNFSDELISSYIKFAALNREVRKYDLKITRYGFDINPEKGKIDLYLKVLYKDYFSLDGHVLFNYMIQDGVVYLDMQEIIVEDMITIPLEKIQELNVKTEYKFKYPAIEISPMFVIDKNYLMIDSYHNDKLVVKYRLFDYIYDYYENLYETGNSSLAVCKTIKKKGLDKFVKNNYPYIVFELENCGIDIR
ncbi:MAG: hypothetical protein ACOX1F_02805 [Erysipelotrichaceae bacterium]